MPKLKLFELDASMATGRADTKTVQGLVDDTTGTASWLHESCKGQ